MITETAAATCGSVAASPPSPAPTPAMMNANSPVCATLIPARRLSRVPWPVRNAPTPTPSVLPTMSTATSTAITGQWASAIFGSSSMPTATKKMAPNMSRSGRTSCSTTRPAPDS